MILAAGLLKAHLQVDKPVTNPARHIESSRDKVVQHDAVDVAFTAESLHNICNELRSGLNNSKHCGSIDVRAHTT